MRLKTAAALLLWLAITSLSGCAVGPHESIVLENVPTMSTPGIFAAGSSILQGTDISSRRDGWHVGDRLLLGLLFDGPRGREVYYLLLQVTAARAFSASAPIAASRHQHVEVQPVRGIALTLYNDDVKIIGRSMAWAPLRLLQHGPYDIAALIEAARLQSVRNQHIAPNAIVDALWSGEMGRRAHLGMAAIASTWRGLASSSFLAKLAFQATTLGQQLAMLAYQPVLTIDESHIEAIRPESPAGRPGYQIPIEMKLGDRIALRAILRVDRPDAPLGLTGGIISLDGENAADPRKRFAVRLLACHRGSGPAVTTENNHIIVHHRDEF